MSTEVRLQRLEESELPSKTLTELRFPSSTPRFQIPLDEQLEQGLANLEELIEKGYFGRALARAKEIRIADSTLAQHYQMLVQQKVSRTNLRIAEKYHVSGDLESARKHYNEVLQTAFRDEVLTTTVKTAADCFERLVKIRGELLEELVAAAANRTYEDWCPIKNRLIGTRLVTDDVFQATFRADLVAVRPPTKFPLPPVEFAVGDVGYIDPVRSRLRGSRRTLPRCPPAPSRSPARRRPPSTSA